MRERDDRELVAAAQGGDRDALDALLRRHYDLVHAVCRRIAGGTRDADDAAQEAMIGIVRGLPRFDGRSSVSTWMYRIATNAALDELRRRRRRPALHVVDDDGPPHEEMDPVAHRRVDAVVDRLALDDALGRLPDEFRAAVVLRDVGRPRLRRDRRGARRPRRHRQVPHRPRPGPARDDAREPRRPRRTSNAGSPTRRSVDERHDMTDHAHDADRQERVRAYLDGELDEPGRTAVEADRALVAEAAAQRAVRAALADNDPPPEDVRERALAAALAAFDAAPASTPPPVSLTARRRSRWLMPAAAAAIVVVIAGGAVAVVNDDDGGGDEDSSAELQSVDDAGRADAPAATDAAGAATMAIAAEAPEATEAASADAATGESETESDSAAGGALPAAAPVPALADADELAAFAAGLRSAAPARRRRTRRATSRRRRRR